MKNLTRSSDGKGWSIPWHADGKKIMFNQIFCLCYRIINQTTNGWTAACCKFTPRRVCQRHLFCWLWCEVFVQPLFKDTKRSSAIVLWA